MANFVAGRNPQTAAEVNVLVGGNAYQFVSFKDQISRLQRWLAAADLKIAPYNMSSADEADIKSAISGLDTALQAISMTFLDRLRGA
jgi:hypothetical protein